MNISGAEIEDGEFPDVFLKQVLNDSSPRDPKQGERGKIDKFNTIGQFFGFFAKMELGASR